MPTLLFYMGSDDLNHTQQVPNSLSHLSKPSNPILILRTFIK